MRATCDRCEGLQPPDWVASDLCVHCGEAVRRDVRCAWCASWTPHDVYCRICGAEVIDEAHVAAARMLKDAGVDRFTIASRLASMDPAQRDNFTRIYQRHAAAVIRHVDELHHLEQFLHHRGFAAALEDRLIPELPWPDEVLQRYSVGSLQLGGDPAVTAARIATGTPFETTRQLAQLVRLRLDDFDAAGEACAAFSCDDATVRAEAALVLTSWRVRLGVGSLEDRVEGGRPAVIAELRNSPFRAAAAVRLAVLEQAPPELAADVIDSPDRELAMAAVLLGNDPDRLEAALTGDPMERLAAADVLARLGVTRCLGPVLAGSDDAVRGVILQTLAFAKRPVPELTDIIVGIIETTTDSRVRETATRVVTPSITSAQALRILTAAAGDRQIAQSLLQRTSLPPEGLAALVDTMIDRREFSASMFGAAPLASDGRLPDSFVPTRWVAAPESLRTDLLSLAELQLGKRGDESLHRFVLHTVFGEQPGEIRSTAWWVLHRWYRSLGEYAGRGPFRLEVAPIERFFGSVDALLVRLVDVLGDDTALRSVGFFELIAGLFTEADDAFVAAVQANHAVGHDLVVALAAAIDHDYWPNTIEAMITLLSRISTIDPWREEAIAALRSVDRAGNYHFDLSLRRLELSRYGMPEPLRWKELPLDFVPWRFAATDAAGQLELLALVDHQLIHNDRNEATSVLLDWVAGVGADGPSPTRERAAEIHRERARGHSRPEPPSPGESTSESERGPHW